MKILEKRELELGFMSPFYLLFLRYFHEHQLLFQPYISQSHFFSIYRVPKHLISCRSTVSYCIAVPYKSQSVHFSTVICTTCPRYPSCFNHGFLIQDRAPPNWPDRCRIVPVTANAVIFKPMENQSNRLVHLPDIRSIPYS